MGSATPKNTRPMMVGRVLAGGGERPGSASVSFRDANRSREGGVPERVSGFAREAEAALEALRAHYFWIHLCAQSACSLLFVTGSTLMLFDATKPFAPWVFLAGSLAFATLPIIRLAHEKGHRALRWPRNGGEET